MSTYVYLNCTTCDESSDTDINHGWGKFREVLKLWPYVYEVMKHDTSDQEVFEAHMTYHGTEVYNFLYTHHDHTIEIRDEYGQTYPLEEEKT